MILSAILSLAKFYPKNDDRIFLAAEQILNDLNYVRSLALMQNSFRTSDFSIATKDEWFKARWQLYFIRSKSATNNEQTYTIFLDKNGDANANLGRKESSLDREIALDIINKNKLMNSGQSGVISKDDERSSERFNIEKTYGLDSVKLFGSCSSSTRIIFDEEARLYSPLRNAKNEFDKILFTKDQDCIIRLSNSRSQNICIVIDSLSGYAYIPEFKDKNTQLIRLKSSTKACSLL